MKNIQLLKSYNHIFKQKASKNKKALSIPRQNEPHAIIQDTKLCDTCIS
jgi:hypothetical protein